VFIAFLVAMVSFASYGFAEGDVAKYLAPVDGSRHICGYGSMKTKPYLHFDLAAGIFSEAECVAACPKGTSEMLGYCMPDFDDPPTADQAAFEKEFQLMLTSNAAGR
jgi:hypothetical protein